VTAFCRICDVDRLIKHTSYDRTASVMCLVFTIYELVALNSGTIFFKNQS